MPDAILQKGLQHVQTCKNGFEDQSFIGFEERSRLHKMAKRRKTKTSPLQEDKANEAIYGMAKQCYPGDIKIKNSI